MIIHQIFIYIFIYISFPSGKWCTHPFELQNGIYCTLVIVSAMNRDDAATACVNQGGNLVTVDSQEKSDALKAILADKGRVPYLPLREW